MFRRAAKILPPGLPHCLKKRRLLNDPEVNPALCRDLGEKFLALEWWEDALKFFQKAGDDAGLARIKAHVLETGDVYLMSRVGSDQDPELWRRVADQALALGKLHFARKAYERADDAEKSAAVRRLIEEEAPLGSSN
jgi:tetratricopeptide (TPR) repeat protein